jgi:glutamine synthetase
MFQSTELKKIRDRINKEKIEFIDLRFTDTQGLFHHFTVSISAFTDSLIQDGLVFDGSSLNGWKTIDDSDMLLMPDLSHVVSDPFSQDPTLIIFCTVNDPVSKSLYINDPRSTALKAEAYLRQTGFADTAYFGPEPEFFVFDAVRFNSTPLESYYSLNASERINENDGFDADPHHAHRPQLKGGYLPVMPIDSGHNMRAEMLKFLGEMGLKPEKHHHEVAANQHELGFEYSTLLRTADSIQLFKYVVHNVAVHHGKTATFMPKPLFGDNGSGMHVHQSLWRKNQPLFQGNLYANLSETALYYIGGILHHAHALNAFTNATTNSYKRLVPGYEAPVCRAYSARNRSAAVRIPHVLHDKARRIEVRFPDPACNPYLALSALLMAGLDGINQKISPGDAIDNNLYALDKKSAGEEMFLASSLRNALGALDQDRSFLKQGDVFSDHQIDAYIALKMQEVTAIEEAPHPREFSLYYSL